MHASPVCSERWAWEAGSSAPAGMAQHLKKFSGAVLEGAASGARWLPLAALAGSTHSLHQPHQVAEGGVQILSAQESLRGSHAGSAAAGARARRTHRVIEDGVGDVERAGANEGQAAVDEAVEAHTERPDVRIHCACDQVACRGGSWALSHANSFPTDTASPCCPVQVARLRAGVAAGRGLRLRGKAGVRFRRMGQRGPACQRQEPPLNSRLVSRAEKKRLVPQASCVASQAPSAWGKG